MLKIEAYSTIYTISYKLCAKDCNLFMLVLIQMINVTFQVYTLMLFIRIISSWVPQMREYQWMRFITYYTDPYLNFFRRFVPPLGMFDLSPIVAFICLSFMQNILIHLLITLV